MTNEELNIRLQELIATYDSVVKVIDTEASSQSDRAYGSMIREVKGKLQEHISEEIVRIAWSYIGGAESDIEINSNKIKIPIRTNYIEQIQDQELRSYIQSNQDKYYYGLSVDKHIFIRGNFVSAIECKAYTENAMIKRILVDFMLLKTRFPQLTCYLFQLESQMGGDYSTYALGKYGSRITHSIMSYFPTVHLHIFTFLTGERDVQNPIHKVFKPLELDRLREAVSLMADDLKQYL